MIFTSIFYMAPHIKTHASKSILQQLRRNCCVCFFVLFADIHLFHESLFVPAWVFMCSTKHINHKPLSTLLHSTKREKKSFFLTFRYCHIHFKLCAIFSHLFMPFFESFLIHYVIIFTLDTSSIFR